MAVAFPFVMVLLEVILPPEFDHVPSFVVFVHCAVIVILVGWKKVELGVLSSANISFVII